MSPVTPIAHEGLTAWERALLGGEVLLTYTRVRWVMRDDDAARAVRRLRVGAAGGSQGPQTDSDRDRQVLAAWRLALATRKVLGRLPTDSRCLFSSLTLMSMLERRGIRQTVVVAVRPRPFAAHAWVEVGGEAVLPAAETGYERLLEL
jgi:hypothetical protein